MQQNESIKVILVGDSELKRLFVNKIRSPNSILLFGMDFFYVKGSNNKKFEIWDLAGQEKFQTLKLYYKNAKVVIYFDATADMRSQVLEVDPNIIQLDRNDYGSEMDCLDVIGSQLSENEELLTGYNQNGLFGLENTNTQQPKILINETQKNIIQGTLRFILDDIVEALDQKDAVDVLKGLYLGKLSSDQIKKLKQFTAWESAKQICDIFDHPCPQNRSENYPYFRAPDDSNMVVYKNKEGKPSFEEKGLLSLTARNDDSISITKDAVTTYIKELVNQKIEELQNKNSEVNNFDM